MSVTRMDVQELETLNRYLAGRLADAECIEFEKRLTQEPELVRELEAIARFKVGLQVLHERGELEATIRDPHWSYRWLAIAAAVLVLAIGAFMFRNLLAPGEPSMLAAVPAALTDRQGNVLPSAGSFTVLRKRVTTADAVIDLPPPGHAIELRVLPDSPPPRDGFSVSLWQQAPGADARKLGAVSHVSPATDGFLNVFMDATRLAPGEYLLVLSSGQAARPSSGDAYRIAVNPRPN